MNEIMIWKQAPAQVGAETSFQGLAYCSLSHLQDTIQGLDKRDATISVPMKPILPRPQAPSLLGLPSGVHA